MVTKLIPCNKELIPEHRVDSLTPPKIDSPTPPEPISPCTSKMASSLFPRYNGKSTLLTPKSPPICEDRISP